MRYTTNALNILTLKKLSEEIKRNKTAKENSFKGIGNAWIVKNIKGNKTTEEIVWLLNRKFLTKLRCEDFEVKRKKIEEEIIQRLENFCDGFVAYGDPNFPQHRGKVKDSEKPVLLYYKGNIDLLSIDNLNITVIGLLNPDSHIEEREREIVSEFVKKGATIVSGLAFGCDTIAHKQALDSNGKTVAILPSPLSNIMPFRNRLLAYKIVEEGGLLISEYEDNFESKWELNKRYQERDRLQALFCDTIVLIASYAKDSAERWENLREQKLDSGARLAMGYAKDYCIPRVVMYDELLDQKNPMFDLNRDLRKEQDVFIINKNNMDSIILNILQNIEIIKSRVSYSTTLID